MGEEDEVVQPEAVFVWIASMSQGVAPKLARMPGTSHFFHGKLMDLRGVVKNGVREQLLPPA